MWFSHYLLTYFTFLSYSFLFSSSFLSYFRFLCSSSHIPTSFLASYSTFICFSCHINHLFLHYTSLSFDISPAHTLRTFLLTTLITSRNSHNLISSQLTPALPASPAASRDSLNGPGGRELLPQGDSLLHNNLTFEEMNCFYFVLDEDFQPKNLSVFDAT